MGSLLVTLIRSNSVAAVLSALLLLSSVYCLWLRSEVRTLDGQLAVCNTKNASLVLSNTSLLASIRQQNAAIIMLSKETEARKKRAEKAMQTAKAQAKGYSIAAQTIADKKMAGDECDQLKQLLRDFFTVINP